MEIVMSNEAGNSNRCTRRSVLAAMAGMPVGAAVAQRVPKPPTLAELNGPAPLAQLGKLKISRLIFGGNQIADYNHCNRYPYVNQLISAYYTPEKIASALQLSEKCGVNTILTNPTFFPKLQNYWKNSNGRIQLISDCGYPSNLQEAIQRSIDFGAVACYIHGGVADRLARESKLDEMGKALDLMRKNRVPAGIGAHQLRTVRRAVEAGLLPDFWMVTFHPMKWGESGELEPGFDEIQCPNPEEVAAFMKERKEPWIAFKTLAVGVVPPAEAFKFAFNNGADFICVGMFEWQLVEDVNIALDAVKGAAKRPRPWRAVAAEV
jgi:hypothetical protein